MICLLIIKYGAGAAEIRSLPESDSIRKDWELAAGLLRTHRVVKILKFKLKLFASFREVFGNSEVDYELPEASVASDLMDDIFKRHESLERFRGHVVISINKKAVPLEQEIHDGDEVAILPPVSGGYLR